ncbi:MAG: CCA tRNA nucleotidyltransferase [Alphaproteobacteria bacterium]
MSLRDLTFSFPWLQQHRFVLDLLAQAGGEGRFVGGAVRDSLLGQSPSDFDIATTLLPEQVSHFITLDGGKVIPTGIRHGTVTAVFEQQAYEITTLRQDLETDGRHAVVGYTTSWEADASRRDFTMNALFLDREGNLYDFFGGAEDLRQSVVKFIGNPSQRVQEDYLRILRFFRFQVRYGLICEGNSIYHSPSLEACLEAKTSLIHLAKERITEELMWLLESQNVFPVLKTLLENKFLELILGHAGDAESSLRCFEALEILESTLKHPANPLLRLFLISGKQTQFNLLRLSKKQQQLLNLWCTFPPTFTQKTLVEALYFHASPLVVEGFVWIQAVERLRKGELLSEVQQYFQISLRYISQWVTPAFPLTGQDILNAGIPQGPEIKKQLQALEAWWVEQDFTPDRQACLIQLKKSLDKT